MLKIRFLAFGFIVVIFAAVARADLLDFEGLMAAKAENFNSAAIYYDIFSKEAELGSARQELSFAEKQVGLSRDENFLALAYLDFYGAVNSDKKHYASLSPDVVFKFNAPLMAGISDIVVGGNLRAGLTQVTERNEIYIETNVKDVDEIDFSEGKYLTEEYFIFTKKISSVPDPSSFFLLGVGILALAAARRKFSI